MGNEYRDVAGMCSAETGHLFRDDEVGSAWRVLSRTSESEAGQRLRGCQEGPKTSGAGLVEEEREHHHSPQMWLRWMYHCRLCKRSSLSKHSTAPGTDKRSAPRDQRPFSRTPKVPDIPVTEHQTSSAARNSAGSFVVRQRADKPDMQSMCGAMDGRIRISRR